MTTKIQVPVSDEVAALYGETSEQGKSKISVLLGIWLREMRDSDPGVLDRMMERISQQAQANGLTPEILAEILADDE